MGYPNFRFARPDAIAAVKTSIVLAQQLTVCANTVIHHQLTRHVLVEITIDTTNVSDGGRI
ncbi:MAG: hypothetical protein ACJAZC_003000 [Cryomorphaceae bacterium]